MDFNEIDTQGIDLNKNQYSPLPEGEYLVIMEKVESKSNEAKGAKYLSCKFQVIGEKYAGKVFFQNITVKNSSEKATELGLKLLNSICKAIGYPDSPEVPAFKACGQMQNMLGKPFIAKVRIEKNSDPKYSDSNSILFAKPADVQYSGGTGNTLEISKYEDDDIPF